jgi:hypothetical protein
MRRSAYAGVACVALQNELRAVRPLGRHELDVACMVCSVRARGRREPSV